MRFTAQWAMVPPLALGAVLVGGGVGAFRAWLAANPPADDQWVEQAVETGLPLILVIALLGMVTNSWTIAILMGALAGTSAFLAGELASLRWDSDYAVDAQQIVTGCSLAVIAGGTLGLSGCLWHHESRWTQALGAGVLGGALAWSGLQHSSPLDWSREPGDVLAWIAGGLALMVILRCRRPGFVLVALAIAVLVATAIATVDGGGVVDLQSVFENVGQMVDETVQRMRRALDER